MNKTFHRVNGYNVIEFNKTNIYIIEDIIPTDLCKIVIDSMDKSDLKKIYHAYRQNVECYLAENTASEELHKILVNKLHEIADIIRVINSNIQIYAFSKYQLRKVYGETRLHSDGIFNGFEYSEKQRANIKMVRSCTMVAVLNDNYNGGVYHFPYQGITFRLKAGSAVFFPPFWTHPHEVSRVGEGEFRYIFSTWCLENPEDT